MIYRSHSLVILLALMGLVVTSHSGADAEDKPVVDTGNEPTALNKSGTVLVDFKGKRLLIKSDVVLREGMLEMLACLKQTKEHESILSVDAKAQLVHAGLIKIGRAHV